MNKLGMVGSRVRALVWVTESGDGRGSLGAKFPDPDYVHAKPGELGTIVCVDPEPDGTPTVRWDRTGTATIVRDPRSAFPEYELLTPEVPVCVEVHSIEVQQLAGVVFLRPVQLQLVQRKADWEASIPSLGREAASTALGAQGRLAELLVEQTKALVGVPTSQLSIADAARKGFLLSIVDVLNSDIGLDHRPDRYVLGRVEGARFVPIQNDLPQMALDAPPADAEGLWFAHVTVQRDGWPLKVLKLEPAVSQHMTLFEVTEEEHVAAVTQSGRYHLTPGWYRIGACGGPEGPFASRAEAGG